VLARETQIKNKNENGSKTKGRVPVFWRAETTRLVKLSLSIPQRKFDTFEGKRLPAVEREL
jgi:hypothetical protein